jgi:hypothetical protein
MDKAGNQRRPINKTGKGRPKAALFPRDPNRVISAFLIASVFLYGLYPYWCALLAGAFLIILLCFSLKSGRLMIFPFSLPALFICVSVLFYLVSVIWAVDKGMAVFGFLKYLPVPVFIVLIATLGLDKEKMLQALARAGGLSVAASLLLSMNPAIHEAIFQNGRFSGPFLYANSYGLFLLACIVILSVKKPAHKMDYAICILCASGIILTGSRSLLILAVGSVALLLFINWRFVLTAVSGALVTGMFLWLLNNTGALQRSTDISFASSEWITRIAYYQDGLHLAITHPLGLGHSGWWYLQPVAQTSVYNVRLIHNWLLQAMLDIGIVPALLLIAAAVLLLLYKGHTLRDKLLIVLLLGHSLIDFNLAFLPNVFILILLLPVGRPLEMPIRGKRLISLLFLSSVLVAASLWLGTASFLSFMGQDKAAATMYPFYTDTMEKIIVTENDPEQALFWAERILKHNRYVFDAYDVKAKVYADRAWFLDAVAMKQEVLAISRLHGADYDELLMYIHFALQQADAADDAETCLMLTDLALSIPAALEAVENSMSQWAYKIKHTPTLFLSDQSLGFLAYLEGYRETLTSVK